MICRDQQNPPVNKFANILSNTPEQLAGSLILSHKMHRKPTNTTIIIQGYNHQYSWHNLVLFAKNTCTVSKNVKLSSASCCKCTENV